MTENTRSADAVQSERLRPRQFAPQGTPYPRMEELPETTYMSASEVLCWIAYRRPINKWLFYGPVEWAPNSSLAELERALHEKIPEPKPVEDPMPKATSTLIKCLQEGRLRAFDDDSTGMPVIPREIFHHSVTITCRGHLEADEGKTPFDWERGREILGRCSPPVVFLTSEVRECFPARSACENDQLKRARDFIRSELQSTTHNLKRKETVVACIASTGVTNAVAQEAFVDVMPVERRIARGRKK